MSGINLLKCCCVPDDPCISLNGYNSAYFLKHQWYTKQPVYDCSHATLFPSSAHSDMYLNTLPNYCGAGSREPYIWRPYDASYGYTDPLPITIEAVSKTIIIADYFTGDCTNIGASIKLMVGYTCKLPPCGPSEPTIASKCFNLVFYDWGWDMMGNQNKPALISFLGSRIIINAPAYDFRLHYNNCGYFSNFNPAAYWVQPFIRIDAH
jgi:hypothetical protein